MSGPAYVVLPVSGASGQYQNQNTTESRSPGTNTALSKANRPPVAQAIQDLLHRKTHPEEYEEPEHHGPLKDIIGTRGFERDLMPSVLTRYCRQQG
jgi:hypothetical protein